MTTAPRCRGPAEIREGPGFSCPVSPRPLGSTSDERPHFAFPAHRRGPVATPPRQAPGSPRQAGQPHTQRGVTMGTRRRGFTLIELLVVVATIGLLTALLL